MAHVVFLRGVNVGGARAFSPKALAEAIDAVNLGAAGTFVVERATSEPALRREIARHLPFETELLVCPADEIAALLRDPPFGAEAPTDGVKWFLTVMAGRPKAKPPLPLERPDGKPWEVRVVGVERRYAFSLWRRQGRGLLYPNEVVEKSFGVAATTRGWPTVRSIGKILGV